jgi:hypothetical protein
MPQGAAEWRISGDAKRVEITIPAKPHAARVVLDAAKLDAFIAQLGSIRLGLMPESTPASMKNGPVPTVNNSPFELGSAPGSSDRVILLHDPRYGPVAFRFGENAAKQIGEALIAGRRATEI